jgi:hypothetical protein
LVRVAQGQFGDVYRFGHRSLFTEARLWRGVAGPPVNRRQSLEYRVYPVMVLQCSIR